MKCYKNCGYDPHHPTRSGLGTFIILDHVSRALRAGLPYVYLGYWVEGSARMQYKVRFRPLEKLGRDGWVRFDPDEQTHAITRAVATARVDFAALGAGLGEGDGKDGVPGRLHSLPLG